MSTKTSNEKKGKFPIGSINYLPSSARQMVKAEFLKYLVYLNYVTKQHFNNLDASKTLINLFSILKHKYI